MLINKREEKEKNNKIKGCLVIRGNENSESVTSNVRC